MAYVLVLIGIVAAFVWATPARGPVGQALHDSVGTLAAYASDAGEPLAAGALHLLGQARGKALELLREQIHGAVDDVVR